MPQPSDKTNRKAALTGGGKKSVSKNVHHLHPIGMPDVASASVAGSTNGSEGGASESAAEPSEHQRPVTQVGPLPVRRWRGATALAYEVNGYKEFKVVAPRTIEDATNSFPHPTDEDDIIVDCH